MIGSSEADPRALDELLGWTHRLAADASWTVAGGGNTSIKTVARDALGRQRHALWVKGSGVDMSEASETDFVAVDLEGLRELATFKAIDDDIAANEMQRAVIQPGRRRPSVETLMHALVPSRFVFHVHADAICAIAKHVDGGKKTAEVLGERFAWIDWVQPGVELARRVAALRGYDGVVMAHHGLVAWNDDPERCFQLIEKAIAEAQRHLLARGTSSATSKDIGQLSPDDERRFLLAIRGRLCKFGHRVAVTDRRLRLISDRADLHDIVRAGVSSADHMLRIGPWSCAIVDPQDIASAVEAIDNCEERFDTYLGPSGQESERRGELLGEGTPRVLLVPGIGAVVTGSNEREARERAEVALHTHLSAGAAIAAFGEVSVLERAALLEWSRFSPELAKLKDRPTDGKMSGRVIIVTGAASGIGRTVTRELARQGASVVAADLDGGLLGELADELGEAGCPEMVPIIGNLVDENIVSRAVSAAIERFGGLDGVVLNIGIGVSGRLEELDSAQWRRALDVNLTSAFLLTREAIRVMRVQGIGGSLVYIASKNALGPGAGFGSYSVSKAGMVQLMRIAAMEGGELGIRANAVNPDAVFDNSRFWAGSLASQRAAAHGVAENDLAGFYADRNLLHREVRTRDVAEAVIFLLADESSRTTGSLIPVDGGVASAFPR